MIFKLQQEVNTYLCDRDSKLAIHSLAKLFQDVAEHHSSATGIGYYQLLASRKTWVLLRVKYKVNRRPKLFEMLTLQTWSRNCDGLLASRDFEFLSSEGEVLVSGTSVWATIDIDKRRPIRFLPEELKVYEHHPDKVALQENLSRLALPTDMESAIEINPVFSEVDKAFHVNNAEYLKFCIDFLYSQGLEISDKISTIEINYVNETAPTDTLTSGWKKDGTNIYFQLQNSKGVAANIKIELSE